MIIDNNHALRLSSAFFNNDRNNPAPSLNKLCSGLVLVQSMMIFHLNYPPQEFSRCELLRRHIACRIVGYSLQILNNGPLCTKPDALRFFLSANHRLFNIIGTNGRNIFTANGVKIHRKKSGSLCHLCFLNNVSDISAIAKIALCPGIIEYLAKLMTQSLILHYTTRNFKFQSFRLKYMACSVVLQLM